MTRTDDLPHILTELCPMHAILDASGQIVSVGPTLQKLRPDAPMTGQLFLKYFDVQFPHGVRSLEALACGARNRLKLRFRDEPKTPLQGVILPRGADGGLVVNLGLGLSILDAVRDYALTNSDFAATDIAMELLYLVEANSAAMEASRTLNTRLKGAMIAAEEQAFTDTLTGLKNRRAMDHVVARLRGAGHEFTITHMDLDFFKAVNDTLGHAAGDHVLQQVARIMVQETRAADTVARIGGDEFVMIFDGMTNKLDFEQRVLRIIEKISKPMYFNGRRCAISASAGSVLVPVGDRRDGAALLHDADLALYAAKRAGRARHFFYEKDMTEADRFATDATPEPRRGAVPNR